MSYDGFGNALTGDMGGATWAVQAFADTLSDMPGVAFTLASSAVTDNLNGSHTLRLRLTQGGDYLLSVTMGGVHAAGSPFEITAAQQVSSVMTNEPRTQVCMDELFPRNEHHARASSRYLPVECFPHARVSSPLLGLLFLAVGVLPVRRAPAVHHAVRAGAATAATGPAAASGCHHVAAVQPGAAAAARRRGPADVCLRRRALLPGERTRRTDPGLFESGRRCGACGMRRSAC